MQAHEAVNVVKGNCEGTGQLRERNKFMKKKKQQGSGESCMYYEYDEDYECYVCEVNLDEDEMARFMEDKFYDCPYYRLGDEYMIVRKQM